MKVRYILEADVPLENRSKLEALLKESGAKILSTEVLSIARQRFTRLDTAPTYAEGIQQLQEAADLTEKLDHLHNSTRLTRPDGSPIYRPLTVAENIAALVESFNTNISRSMKERLALINHFTDSCTGIIYKANSPKFKLQQISDRLITIAPDFNASFLPIVYKEAEEVEIDTANATDGLYNQPLTEKQVLKNRGWLTAMGDTEEGKKTLAEFKNIVFATLSQRRNIQRENLMAMGFYARQKPTDQLRDLVVGGLGDDSSAGGDLSLYDGASFLLLAQKSAPKATPKK